MYRSVMSVWPSTLLFFFFMQKTAYEMRISDWSSDVCSSDLKRGFNNIFGTDFAIVNLGQVQKLVDAKKLDAKKTVDHDALKAAGVARGGKDGVRLLAKGDLTAKLTFAVAGASKGAIEAVEKAGGKVELPEPNTEAPEGKKAKRKAEAAKKN